LRVEDYRHGTKLADINRGEEEEDLMVIMLDHFNPLVGV
jgi:hypothetical protein